MRLPFAKYEIYMQRLFYKLGYLIGLKPWCFVYSLISLTIISSLGFLRFKQINNARVTFTDSEAPSRYEGRVVEEFLQQNGTLYMIELLISAADNGSLLRPQHFFQLSQFADEVTNRLKIYDENSKNFLGFRNFCHPYCQKNDPFFAVMKMFEQNVTSVELTYPMMEIFGEKVFIGNNFYRITLDPFSKRLMNFRTVLLHFFLVYTDSQMMGKWENELVQLCYESGRFDLLRPLVGSDNLVAKEVKKLGTSTAPLLAVALVALMFFLFICSFRSTFNESKPTEAILGGLIPILASVTTVGLVSAGGLPFQSIVVSTLFLLLAIGIDDVFIMLAAWHRSDKEQKIPQRIAQVVQEAGCSMMITTVTNVISFGNGVLSTTPVLQTFAIYSTVASIICFIFQLLLFPAILAINEQRRGDNEKGICFNSLPKRIEFINQLSKFHDWFFRVLIEFVCSWWMKVIVFLFLMFYWTLSLDGVFKAKSELGIQHIAPSNSKISLFKREYELVVKKMQPLAIVIQTPGDLRNATIFRRLKELIQSFESEQFSYGRNSTFCWLFGYEEYLRFYDSEFEEFSYIYLPDFLDSSTNEHFKGTIKLNERACREDSPQCVQSFLLTTGFTNVSYYNEMYPVIEKWRAIAQRFPEFSVISYTERHNYADQSANLPDVIWQTLWSEVICMGISFVIFILDTLSICAGLFALISVNLGVFGFLTLWGVQINPISMAALLMSIGFSVDISAHISYHYYETKAKTSKERLEITFLHIGWPTIQGAMSTLLAMVFILLKPSYLGIVFLKTVFLVVLFGLLHGLVVLPVFLSLFASFQKSSR
ncbi:unnamed protein product, partial [Mesorhabditis belari]|uniref:SSD domain-containing protein n=1 Tax=Mesorhabditis belari TaxID=2138241 RepID=A0AAF3F2T5_9BILA